MRSVEEWAVKIAEEVSPEEVDLAPVWAEAFVKGGKDRQELFKQTNAQAAGFLPGTFLPLTLIMLKALTIVTIPLLNILSLEGTGKFLEGVKNAFALGEVFGKSSGWFSVFSKQKKEETRISEAVYTQLNEVMARLDKEMEVLSLEQHKSDNIKLLVMRLFLENPLDATQFLNKLSEKK